MEKKIYLATFKNLCLPPVSRNEPVDMFAYTQPRCNNDGVHCSLTTEY
jgi:hypothetical protein